MIRCLLFFAILGFGWIVNNHAFTSVLPTPHNTRYYVSPKGEDKKGNGSYRKPFKTLAYAASKVPSNEGATIELSAGTFIETKPTLLPLGVSIMGAGQEKTILSSTGVSYPDGVAENKLWYDGSLVQLVSPHYSIAKDTGSMVIAPAEGNQEISGFTIDGNNKKLKAGVWVENRNNVTMHHVSFKNLDQRGAVFSPGEKRFYSYPKYYMRNIRVFDCSFINCGKDLPDETLGNLCIAQLDGAALYNITIKDNEGYGIKFIHDGYFINTSIHDCKIELNETDSKWGEDIAIELWNNGPGNKIYNIHCNTWLSIVNHEGMFAGPKETENMKVHDIRMIDQDGVSNKEAVEIGAPGVEVYSSYFENKGIGIAIWDMGRENIIIRNNIFHNSVIHDNWSGAPAVYIDNSRNWDFKNIRIYNNIFDQVQYGVRIKGNRIFDIQIKNNVFLSTTVADVASTGQRVSFGNNLKFKGNSNDWVLTGVEQVGTNIIQDPGFLQKGNRWASYYKPASNKVAVVDKGVDVQMPFKGEAPDIGRWEFEKY
ncbi:MAG: hypothetical protein H7Z13_05315 [Ferruginibacter sp.]|nr:hypothetical protein [Ferruginibacter sp.]